MFKTLYAKLALTLAVVLALVGAVVGSFSWYITRQHADLVVQTFNKDLAANLIRERRLIENGELSDAMLKETFAEYMAINPSIEIYLLDTRGGIISHSAPGEKVVRESVSLKPIQQFLQHRENKPVLGDDPRSESRGKAFSVAPIHTNSGMNGYLYVVLRGEAYDDVAQALEQQVLLRLGLQVLAMSLVFGLLTGLIILWLVTRRLHHLTHRIDRFQRQRDQQPGEIDIRRGDEVERLSLAFDAMSGRIVDQIHSLEENDRNRRDLVANISHDLRTPISAILGYLERLKFMEGSASRTEQLEYVDTALRNASRMSKMIEELFELAKLEAEGASPESEPFALSDLVQDVVHQQKLAAQQHGISISLKSAPELPLVHADIGMIQRVLENLIGNAVIHLHRTGSVVVRLVGESDKVLVSVWDSGDWIPSAELPRIFDRHFQGNGRDEREMGAGLGLTIAKQILALHGAELQVKNLQSGGKTFFFALSAMPRMPR